MTDTFDIRTATQRRVVIGALLLYLALFVAELSTGSRLAAGGADLLVATLALAASVVAWQRADSAGDTEPITIVSIIALVVAAIAIGYEGLATFGLLPRVVGIETLGSLALITALVLYFLDQRD